MSCHSPSVAYVFAKLDYCGIAILTMGSFIPWLYYRWVSHFAKLGYCGIAILTMGSFITWLYYRWGTGQCTG